MKRIATIIMLSMLMISGCAMIAQENEPTISEDSDNKGEVVITANEPDGNSEIAEDKEPNYSDIHPNTNILFELDLEYGKFYEIPRLSEGKEAELKQSNDCMEALMARLENYGVLLNPDSIPVDRFSSTIEYSFLPMFYCHYQDLDFLYVQYPDYRSYFSGNLYIFKKSILKDYIRDIGAIDLDNAFRTIEGNIWLVTMRPAGGSGMAMEVKEWISLTNDNMPVELKYTNYYGSSNYNIGHDIDCSIFMIYNVVEEELYINEQSIPVLKVSWQKEVYDGDKTILLTTSGYAEYPFDISMDWEQFEPFDLSCGELLDGLEEQLNELVRSGTEEEKLIAKQLVDNFATMPT